MSAPRTQQGEGLGSDQPLRGKPGMSLIELLFDTELGLSSSWPMMSQFEYCSTFRT